MTIEERACFGCECSSTEAGKRAIREALSPARSPGQDRPLNLQGKTTAPQSISQKNYPKPAAKPASKKAVRPQGERAWTYCDPAGTPILEVHRSDDGKGKKQWMVGAKGEKGKGEKGKGKGDDDSDDDDGKGGKKGKKGLHDDNDGKGKGKDFSDARYLPPPLTG